MPADAMELAEAVVLIRADMSELKDQFAQMQNMAKGSLNQISDMISTGLVAILASKIMGIGKHFVGMAGDIETSTQKFETLLGTAEEAKRLVAEIADFAAKTPYQMPELEQATQQFLIYGDSAKVAMENLKKLGDIAAISGTPITELATLYARAKAGGQQGTVGQELIGMLTHRGIMTKRDIKEAMGLQSIMQLDRIMSQGGIKWRHIEPIFDKLTEKGGRFFKGMERQSLTFHGLSSTLADNVRLIGASIGQLFLSGSKGFIAAAISMTDKIRAWTQAIVALNERTHGVIGRIGVLVGGMASAVLIAPKLIWAIRAIGSALAMLEIETGIGAIVVAIGAAIAALMYFHEVVSAAVGESGKFEAVGQLWDQVVETMSESWKSFSDGFVAMIQPAIEFFNSLVADLAAWIKENFDLILDVTRLVFRTIGTVVAGNIRMVMYVFQLLFETASWCLQMISKLSGFVFGNVAKTGGSAIRSVLEWLQVLVENWKTVVKMVIAGVALLYTTMFDMLVGLGGVFASVFMGMFNVAFMVAMGIGKVFLTAGANIVDTLKTVGESCRIVFRGLTTMAVTFANGVSDALKAAVTGGMNESINATMEKLKADASQIRDELKSTIGKSEVGKAMQSATADVMEAVNNTIDSSAASMAYQSEASQALGRNMNAMRAKLLADKLALEKQRGYKPGEKPIDQEKSRGGVGGPDIKPGFVGLEEAAKHMQTSILDRPDKQLGVLQNIEDVNRQMLTEAQKGNAIAAKPVEAAPATAG